MVAAYAKATSIGPHTAAAAARRLRKYQIQAVKAASIAMHKICCNRASIFESAKKKGLRQLTKAFQIVA